MMKPMTPAEATVKINLILEQGGFIRFTSHCRDRMDERGATILDVRHTLRYGVVSQDAEWDTNSQNWKYRVAGFDTDGDTMSVITVVFHATLSLLAVTIFEQGG